jgi:hypothetical protein
MKLFLPLVLLIVLAAGCGKKGGGFFGKTGEAVGEKLTDFTKGVGKGIDQRMLVEVSHGPEVQALGLSKTIAKSLGLGESKPGISIYFIAARPVSTTLVVRALNSEGAEIGRAKTKVGLGKDEAAYVNFEFDHQMDTATVHQYSVGL